MTAVKSGGNRQPVYVIAKYEYNASSDQELSVRKNERLRLVDDSKQWWKVENVRYQSGYVPSNYVKKEKPSLLNSLKRHVKKKTADLKISHISAPIPPAPSYTQQHHHPITTTTIIGIPNKPFTALVKFNYDPTRPDELQLKKGEYILVIEKSHDGWWKGQSKLTSIKGWFPSNYVKEMAYCDDDSSSPTPQQQPPKSDEHYEKTAQALYPYSAQTTEELSFDKDEYLTIFDPPNEQTNWLRARNTRAENGLVPRNYVRLIRETSPDTREEENVPEEVVLVEDQLQHQLNDFIDRGDLPSKSWYFGQLSRQECDELLNEYGQDGDFVVRDSETGNRADFSVSLKATPRNKHFRVYVDQSGGHLTIGQRRFGGVEEMIGHYGQHAICTNSDGGKLTLMRALNAPRHFRV